MAIEKVGFDIVSNAQDVLKQLKQIDKQLDALKSAKVGIQVDTKSIDDASKKLEEINKQIESLNKEKSEIIVEYEDVNGATESASKLAESITGIGTSAEEAYSSSFASFRGISSALGSVGSAFGSAGSTLDSFGSKMLSAINPVEGLTSSLVAQLSVFNLLNTTIGIINENIDDAIRRFSTLQRTPLILSELGFDSEAIQRSQDAIVDYVAGTTVRLDDANDLVKQLAGSFGDLDRATDLVIGLNNAFIANGTNTQDASRALRQFVQQINNGVVDARSFRTLQETLQIPLQIIAEEFGLTNSQILYNALQEGELSIDSFIDKIIELGTGEGRIANLAEVAFAGLDNSLEILGNRVTVSVAGIIEAFDNLSVRLTGKKLYQWVDELNAFVRDIGNVAIEWINNADPFAERILEFGQRIGNAIASFNFGEYFAGLKDSGTEIRNTITNFLSFVEPVINRLKDFITDLGNGSFERGLGRIPGEIFNFAIKLKASGKALKLAGGAFTGLSNLFGLIANFKLTKGGLGSFLGNGSSGSSGGLGNLLNGDGISSKILRGATALTGVAIALAALSGALAIVDKTFPDDVGGLIIKLGFIGTIATVLGAVSGVIGKFGGTSITKGATSFIAIAGSIASLAVALKVVDAVLPDDYMSLVAKLGFIAAVGAAFGLIEGVLGTFIGKNITTGALSLIATAGSVASLAIAIKAVDVLIPEDFGNIIAKLAIVGGVATAFGALALIIGTVSASNPLAAIAGIGTLIGVAVEIAALAKAIKVLDENVPSDIESIVDKLVVIGAVVGSFTVVTAAIGALVATGIGALIAGAGIATTIALAYSISEIAQAVKDIDDKVPTNIRSVEKKIENLGNVINILTVVVDPLQVFVRAMSSLDLKFVASSFNHLVDIANSLVELDKIEVPTNISYKMKSITGALDVLRKVEVAGLFVDWVSSHDISILRNSVASYTEIADLLTQLGDVDTSNIRNAGEFTLPAINDALKTLNYYGLFELASSAITDSTLINITNNVNKYIQIAEKLGELYQVVDSIRFEQTIPSLSPFGEPKPTIGNTSFAPILNAIKDINNALDELNTYNLFDSIGSDFTTSTLTNLDTQISLYKEIAQKLKELGEVVTSFNFEDNVVIQTPSYGISKETLGRNSFSPIIDAIRNINSAFEELATFSFDDENFISSDTSRAAKATENLKEQIQSYVDIANLLNETITEALLTNLTNSIDLIDEINNVFSQLKTFSFDSENFFGSNTGRAAEATSNLKNQIQSYTEIATILNETITPELLENISGSQELLGEVNVAFKELATFSFDSENFFGSDTGRAAKATENLGNQLKVYTDSAKLLAETINADLLAQVTKGKELIEKINEVFRELKSDFSWWDENFFGSKTEQAAESTQNLLNQLNVYVTASKSLHSLLDNALVIGDIIVLQELIGSINSIFQLINENTIKDDVKSLPTEKLSSLLSTYADTAENLQRLSEADTSGIVGLTTITIPTINRAFESLSELLGTDIDIDTSGVYDLLTGVNTLESIVNKLNSIQTVELNEESINNILTTVKAVYDGLSELGNIPNLVSVTAVIQAFEILIEQLHGLSEQFHEIGTDYAQNIIDGFLSLLIPTVFSDEIMIALANMQKYENDFKSLGETFGRLLYEAFAKEVSALPSPVGIALVSIQNMAPQFASVGTQFGNNLVSAFSIAISGLSTSISNQVANIQSSLNSLTLPNLRTNINVGSGNPSVGYYSHGGIVGDLFKSRGSDTVPAMLTPKESVLTVGATKFLGSDFIERANKLDFNGAFNRFFKGYSPSGNITNSVNNQVRNIATYHNIQNSYNIHQTVGGNNADYDLNRAMQRIGGGY